MYYYKKVLEIDPDNETVERGLQKIADGYSKHTGFAVKEKNYDRAQLLIKRGLSVVAGDSELLSLQREVTKKQSEQRALEKGQAGG